LAAVVSAMASLSVAGPDLARSTGASQTQLEWIIDAYSLTFASLLLPAGALGDRFGRRRALLGGLALFITASAIAFTAQSANELIILRGLLGAGAAFVMPATLSTITTTFAAAQRSQGSTTTIRTPCGSPFERRDLADVLEPAALTRGPATRLRSYVCGPNVVVMKVQAQPTEVAAQIVYLDQPSAGHFVAQALAQVARVVKEAALQECHFPRHEGSLGER
jgi:hypothetical protein